MPPRLNLTGTSRAKKGKRQVSMPLLPGDMGLLRQIERQREEARKNTAINKPLDYLGPLKDFRPQATCRFIEDMANLDICVVIDSLLACRWADFPRKPNGSFSLNGKIVAQTAEFRAEAPNAVTMGQLYGVFPNQTTQVDQAVSRFSKEAKVRVILMNAQDGPLNIVIKSTEFKRLSQELYPELSEFCEKRTDAAWFEISELGRSKIDTVLAVNLGLLVADPSRPGVLYLAVPCQGRLLKLARQCRTWLLKTITRVNRKFKEMPESQIREKLESTKFYWSRFRGATLEWVLYEAIGGGYIEGFNTPVGRGWKVLKT